MIDKQKIIIEAANNIVTDIVQFLQIYHTEEEFEKYSNIIYNKDYSALNKVIDAESNPEDFEQAFLYILSADFAILLINNVNKHIEYYQKAGVILNKYLMKGQD